MSIGVLLVVVWFLMVMLYLGWQFATDAIAGPVSDQTVVKVPFEEGLLLDLAVNSPADTVTGASVLG
ncbi:MAG: hypothetical protein C4290_02780 [Chloroflexota bacterium]